LIEEKPAKSHGSSTLKVRKTKNWSFKLNVGIGTQKGKNSATAQERAAQVRANRTEKGVLGATNPHHTPVPHGDKHPLPREREEKKVK